MLIKGGLTMHHQIIDHLRILRLGQGQRKSPKHKNIKPLSQTENISSRMQICNHESAIRTGTQGFPSNLERYLLKSLNK